MARRPGLPALLLVTAVTLAGCAGSRDLDLGYPTDYPDHAAYVYDDLASYGTWVDVPEYGTVWCPEVVSSWHPYTVGYWLYTDAGWFWASEDPWGSVPYHYGRWAFDDYYGWVWVPGDIWAPSWVAWRYGPGWVGWAPLPPEIAWYADAGIDLSPYDYESHIDPREWCFTETDGFGTHRMRDRVEPFDKNGRLLKETRNVTKYAAGSHPVETGLTPALLQELRGKEVEPYRIVDSNRPVAKTGLRIRGKQLEVYRPSVDVKDLVRERVREVPPPQRGKSVSSVVATAVRDREKPEIRTAQREEVARASSDETRTATKEEVVVERREPVREPVRERREPVTVTREDAKGRVETEARQNVVTSQREQAAREREEARQRELAAQQQELTQRREEAAREHKEAAQRREEATRQRENAAQRREEAAREREEAARQREEKSQAREKSADREEAEKNRKSSFESRERENTPKRVRGGPAS